MAFYTVVAGAITVGLVYFLTNSGLYIVALAALGVVVAVLGGASGGTTVGGSDIGGGADISFGRGEEGGMSEMMVKDMKLAPNSGKFGGGLILIFYGLGLTLWSVVVLNFFSAGLQ
ncbi:hypothetical protein [Haloarchaeobius sp. DFWS5]|uniref:hypothetical protein n=1 Tax=Haloarchaeobius sp. DFWS5 TaxID=3446114 RepID=UPI003EC134F0